MRALRAAAAPASAAAATLLLAACGGSSSSHPSQPALSPAHVEAAIAQSIKSQRHETASVTCPTGIALHKGTRFYCVAQVGRQIGDFQVTETSDKGAVSYVGLQHRQVPLLDTRSVAAAIEHSIESKRKIAATVVCPAGIPRQQGLSFVCSATAKGQKTTNFVVDQHDSSGHVTYSSR